MESINAFVSDLNNILFSTWVVYALLLTGVLFTIWTIVGQYRALTHGVAVIRGKYDEKDDPGAINHFQALSAALSATVGLGNIGGVALAVALGGPGAVFWMWIIGFIGMTLKMTEVTQSMLYRNTDDLENPHGGPMFVIHKGMKKAAKESPAFCIAAAVIYATIFIWGGFMWGGPIAVTLCSIIALVLLILGFMNGAALGAVIGGIFVITLLTSAITGGNMFQAWNVADVTQQYFSIPHVVTGAILTTVVGAVIIGGIKRIGLVAGRLVPFMCVIYLLAGLFVLFTNAGQIPGLLGLIVKSGLPPWLGGEAMDASGAFLGGTFGYAAMWGIKRALFSSEAGQGSAPIAHSAAKTNEPVREGVVAGLEPFIDTIIVCTVTALVILSSGAYDRGPEAGFADASAVEIVPAETEGGAERDDETTAEWTVQTPPLPPRTAEAKRIHQVQGAGWREGDTVFMLVTGEENPDTGRNIRKIAGEVTQSEDNGWQVDWKNLTSEQKPELYPEAHEKFEVGIYGEYAGAALTAHSFDRVTPGLGKWLISLAAWLFAISTMISWSYYGEQGVYYVCGELSKAKTTTIVMAYKVIYCALIMATTVAAMPLFGTAGEPIIGTDEELDMWTTLGLGVMLVANIPIMLLFSRQAMSAYHGYMGKLKRGEFHPHGAPSVTDVVEGRDVEE